MKAYYFTNQLLSKTNLFLNSAPTKPFEKPIREVRVALLALLGQVFLLLGSTGFLFLSSAK